MTHAEVKDALDGLSAYDKGCVDSGIHDEVLRERVKTFLLSLSDAERRVMLGKIIRELFLTDEQLSRSYGPEDVYSFCRWLDENMGILG